MDGINNSTLPRKMNQESLLCQYAPAMKIPPKTQEENFFK
jgi:hypothetical protein